MARGWWVLGMLAVLVLASACQGTGMGWIPSSLVPTDKATFGFDFVVDMSTGESGFSGSYHDPQGALATGQVVDVAFKGTGVLRPTAPPPEAPPNVRGGCLLGLPTYDSQNPDLPGSGQLELLVCDMDGDGQASPGDYILLQVMPPPLGGPYSGYHNGGFVQGNITVKQ